MRVVPRGPALTKRLLRHLLETLCWRLGLWPTLESSAISAAASRTQEPHRRLQTASATCFVRALAARAATTADAPTKTVRPLWLRLQQSRAKAPMHRAAAVQKTSEEAEHGRMGSGDDATNADIDYRPGRGGFKLEANKRKRRGSVSCRKHSKVKSKW